MKIEIIKWSEFQTRKELLSLTWFRLNSDIFDGETYFKIGNDGLIVFIYLLTKAAKCNKSAFEISLDFVSEKIKMKKDKILSVLENLEQNQIVRVSAQNRAELCPTYITDNTDKQTIQTKQTETFVSEKDFNSAYFLYPLKKGKQKGLQKLKKEISTFEDLELFKKAVEIYSADLKKNKTDAKYIKHFSTFVGEWRDWLEPDAGKSKINNSNASFENQREDANDEFKRLNDAAWK